MSSSEDLLRQPIGRWLRLADRAITEHVNAVLREEGLSRVHWQALNVVAANGEVSRDSLLAALHEFVGEPVLDQIVTDLTRRGWVSETHGDDLKLTDAGEEAHRSVSALIDGVRDRSMRGISREEYAVVIQTLQRMVANLEPAA
jgi:DNA-binding MarR family transcriptional regulator